jgi:hypothetical protein
MMASQSFNSILRQSIAQFIGNVERGARISGVKRLASEASVGLLHPSCPEKWLYSVDRALEASFIRLERAESDEKALKEAKESNLSRQSKEGIR